MALLPNTNYRFNAIMIKISVPFFTEIGTTVLKFYATKKTPSIQSILRKKNKAGVIVLPIFRLYCKAILIKTIQYWHKIRHQTKHVYLLDMWQSHPMDSW